MTVRHAATRTPPTLRAEPLLTPAEAAAWFRVEVRTVARWAQEGRLGCIRVGRGHRRYRAADVTALLAATEEATTP